MSICCHLPEEIIVDILTRLPVKSLIQFRLVCKPWLALISDLRFIKSHLDRTSLNPKNNSLVVHSKPLYSPIVINFFGIDSIEAPVNLFHRIPKICQHQNMYLIGSIHGLVCIFQNTAPYTLILWNPATERLKQIPPPPSKRGRIRYISVGFGYDQMECDYRIIRILSYRLPPSRAEVYSCNIGTWKEVIDPFPNSGYGVRCDLISKGKPYWETRKMGDNGKLHDVLVGFDVQNELFKQFSYPEYSKNEFRISNFLEWMDSVALMAYEELYNDVSLYTLNESCGAWTKMYTLPNLGSLYAQLPVCFSNNGCIVVDDGFGKLYLFDPKKNFLMNFFSVEPTEILDVFSYTESLVSINGMVHVEDGA